MRPMMARSRMSLLFTLAATALLAACSGESTAPKTATLTQASQVRTSPFVPTALQRSLVGIGDGTYSIKFDPSVDNSFVLGANYLSLPANAVCKLDGTSGYGAEFWNASCVPETDSVTITVQISDANTDHPRMDFFPAMRFSPATSVQLYIYVPTDMNTFARTWVMQYCNDLGVCSNEALTDPDLATSVDPAAHMVFRRIKHFSGYFVSFSDGDPAADPPPVVY